jgi:hypothetical protein
MNDQCRAAIEDYYTLKNDYEQVYKKKRKTIMTDIRVTKQDKRDAIQSIKVPCIHCKRMVGTIFSTENRVLKAKCGDASNPCPLNIEIYKGRVTRYDIAFQTWLEDHIKEYSETIVKTKLDVLFQYITEEEAVKIFQETKEELDLYKMGYNTDFQLYLEKTTNSDTKADLESVIKKLGEKQSEMKELLSQYYIKKDNRIFNSIVTIYTEKVIPLVQTIRELKYKYIDLEYDSDENVYYLNAKHYLIRDLETNTLEEDEPRLLSNIK